MLPRVVRLADRLIANSEATRADVLRYLHVDPGKVDVTGLASRWKPLAPEAVQLPKQPYFLALGTLEPRKNLPRTIAAFEYFKALHPETPHRLIVSGRAGWGDIDVAPS